MAHPKCECCGRTDGLHDSKLCTGLVSEPAPKNVHELKAAPSPSADPEPG